MIVIVVPPPRVTLPVDAAEHLDELHEALTFGVEQCIWLWNPDEARESLRDFRQALAGTSREAFIGHPDPVSYSELLANFALARRNSQVQSGTHIVDLSAETGSSWSTSMWAKLHALDSARQPAPWNPDPTGWYELGVDEQRRRLDEHDRDLASTCHLAVVLDQFLCLHLLNFAVMQRRGDVRWTNGTGRKLRRLRELGVPNLHIYTTFNKKNSRPLRVNGDPIPETLDVVTLSRMRALLPEVGWENPPTPARDPLPTGPGSTHDRRLAYGYLPTEEGAPRLMVQFNLPDGLQGYEPALGAPTDSPLVKFESDPRYPRNLQGFLGNGSRAQPIRCVPATAAWLERETAHV